jgi:cyclopropane fatty-acyl-phospholipid synthase-like methyltransferase
MRINSMLIENERTIKYPDAEFYLLTGGPGGVYLVDQITKRMRIKPSDRVLDIGPGHLVSSIFLAKEFGCKVFAYDLWVEASYNFNIIQKYKLEDYIIPIHGDILQLPFAEMYFDKIFAMGSYHYFGKDNNFTPYIAKFLKENGIMGIGGPCHIMEDKTAAVRYYNENHEIELYETPDWWKKHFTKSGVFSVEHSDFAEKGWEMWIDCWEKTYDLHMSAPWGCDDPKLIEKYKADKNKLVSNHVTIVNKKAG